MTPVRISTIALILLLIAGCSVMQAGNKTEIQPPQNEVDDLASLLIKAREQQYNLYAPDTYDQVNALYATAQKQMHTNPADAKENAVKGLRLGKQMENSGNRIKQQLQAIDSARSGAVALGAEKLLRKSLKDTDQSLVSLAAELEKKPDLKPEEKIKELIRAYQKLELRSLKLNILGEADNALDQAEKEELSNFTPKTMRLGEEEYLLGTSVLNTDLTQTDKAFAHAANVLRHVEHATVLTAHIKKLLKKEATLEDILLWHEAQVAKAVEPLKLNLPVEKGFPAIVEAVQTEIKRLQTEQSSLADSVAAGEEKASSLKQQQARDMNKLRQDMEQRMLAAQLESDTEQRRIADSRKRFEFVQQLFSITEAEVYQQGQNILIRAHGFTFKPGSSQVTEDNLTLITKLIDAVETFPDATIEVSGHTDSIGDRKINQQLSEDRAKGVASFISTAGLVEASKISYVGYGSDQPVAPNSTANGRAANRRVEVRIINSDNTY